MQTRTARAIFAAVKPTQALTTLSPPSPGWLRSSIKLDCCKISESLFSFDDIYQLVDVGMQSTDDCVELPVPSLQVIIFSVSILLEDTPHCRRKLSTIQPGVLKVAQKTLHSTEGVCCEWEFSPVDGDLYNGKFSHFVNFPLHQFPLRQFPLCQH